ncbi:MAG: mannitol dehydrogenase family protein, partial [Defluviitaleaceae bacterium]|nr:mannitol dehydrogenase family protein [Defluviitaleaceae bacterium]
MRLNDKALQDAGAWESAGITLPRFDRKAVAAATDAAPVWIHFGAGNIFRAFPAMSMQSLLDRGLESKGIVVAGGDIIDKIFVPHDNLTLLVTLKSNGTIEKTVIGSIVKSLKADSENERDWHQLKDMFAKASLQMVSFTITEKGYALKSADSGLLPDVEHDFKAGYAQPRSYMGKLAALLYERYLAGGCPVAMVSMDNCSQNGTRLQAAIAAFAEKWEESGLADKGFLAYVNDPGRVSFPWSM